MLLAISLTLIACDLLANIFGGPYTSGVASSYIGLFGSAS